MRFRPLTLKRRLSGVGCKPYLEEEDFWSEMQAVYHEEEAFWNGIEAVCLEEKAFFS